MDKNNNKNDDVWKVFDALFEDFDSVFGHGKGLGPGMGMGNGRGRGMGNCELYHTPNFPPVNVYIDEETKDLTLEFALAGYKKDEVDVYFEGDKMNLTLSPEPVVEERRILKKGFKIPSETTSFVVPSSKYKTQSAEAEMVDGVLTVIIRAVDEIKPKRISIK